MSTLKQASATDLEAALKRARDVLDAHTHEIVQWHFHASTGCPFWLEYASTLKFDPLKEIRTFDDLKKFESFKDEWLRGGPVRRSATMAAAIIFSIPWGFRGGAASARSRPSSSPASSSSTKGCSTASPSGDSR